MSHTKTFHIGDVLSVTTDRLLSPDGIEGVYRVVNYMLSDSLYTHQLPRACDDCRPFIIEQHPWLEAVDASGVNTDNWKQFLASLVAKHGKTVDVTPIPNGTELHRNPIDEAVEMVGRNRVVVIDTEDES